SSMSVNPFARLGTAAEFVCSLRAVDASDSDALIRAIGSRAFSALSMHPTCAYRARGDTKSVTGDVNCHPPLTSAPAPRPNALSFQPGHVPFLDGVLDEHANPRHHLFVVLVRLLLVEIGRPPLPRLVQRDARRKRRRRPRPRRRIRRRHLLAAVQLPVH